MKKIFTIIILFFSIILTSCGNNTIYLDKIYVETTTDVSANIQSIYNNYSSSIVNVSSGLINSTGTCVKVTSNGAYFVTGNVFGSLSSVVNVFDKNGKRYSAAITAIDSKNELAMIYVNSTEGFSAVSFSDAAYVKGDYVVILSADENANVMAHKGYISYFNSYLIGTDAATNNCSLGAPIFDITGKCLGIIYSEETKIAEDEYAIGIGYAFNASLSEEICNDLLEGGNITRPLLGVSTYFVNQDLADGIGLNVTLPDSDNYYALVDSVSPGSNAYYAGIKAGDIIYKANGYVVDSNNYLPGLLRTAMIGDTLSLEIIRGTENINISVTFRFA